MLYLREQDLLLWLCTTPGVGGVTIRQLHDYFGDWRAVWQGTEEEMLKGAGVRKQAVRAICQSRQTFDPVAARRQFEPAGIRFVSLVDLEYPEPLRSLYDPPAGLFVQGQLPPCGEKGLAVVGSRTLTAYGRVVTEKLIRELVEKGLTIVSGLARGIDTIAHRATLDVGGQTVAVLGSGLLNIYPRENTKLAMQIADGHGAVISEFPPGTAGKPGHFPVRNRIISGLCQGTLVIEAGERSGSLITADQALEQGRDVYAVPGPITSPQSAGTNRLIQQGAKLVLSAADILEEYGWVADQLRSKGATEPSEPLSGDAARLLAAIGYSETHIDELTERTGWEFGTLHNWLIRLQLRGMITALPGGRYARVEF